MYNKQMEAFIGVLGARMNTVIQANREMSEGDR
jgi:hypothetical protein